MLGNFMRRNQFSFRVENFTKEGNRKIQGYIDANSMHEVLHELLVECHKLYGKEMSFDEFCNQVQTFDEQRFGVTEITEL